VATSTTRRTVRLVLLTVCALAIVALVATIVRQSAQTNSTASQLVGSESDGAAALHPMLALVGDLVDAQSAAVRGASTADAEKSITTAIDQITGVDPEYGVKMQNSQAITNVSNQIHSIEARNLTGRAAYDGYSGLVTLALNLMRHTADTSHLIHDPEVDSYFVMDAAVNRLPDALVYAGRAADLVTLGGGSALIGADGVSAAVARFYVSNSASQVSSGLNQSIDFTSNEALGGNIADRLDQFMAAAAAFAPPTMQEQMYEQISDPTTLAADARKVYATALSLAHFLIFQLQTLLTQRHSGLVGQWRFTETAVGLAVLVALAMLWLLIIGRPHGSHARGALVGETSDEARAKTLVSPLTDPQQLLDQEELVHVGRAVRPRARGRGDAF
jgi:hypothetical protein